MVTVLSDECLEQLLLVDLSRANEELTEGLARTVGGGGEEPSLLEEELFLDRPSRQAQRSRFEVRAAPLEEIPHVHGLETVKS